MPKDPVCGMDVDSSDELKLMLGKEKYYFCSRHCLEKFASENGISIDTASCAAGGMKKKWFKNRVFIISAVIFFILAVSYIVPFLIPFRASFLMYLNRIWLAVLIGFLLGGVIDRFISRSYISKVLSKPEKKTIFSAVILGFFMSACSHGILALSIELHKKGASTPAVVSFLLASPWANMSITVLLISLFGLKAFFMIMAAIIIAINTGFIFQFLEKKGLIEKNNSSVKVDGNFSISGDIRQRIKNSRFTAESFLADARGVFRGGVSLADMVLWWMLIGISISSFISAYVPSEMLKKFMGPTMGGILITLFAATIIEICSEGSAPLAFEIYNKTGALGNSFVFLMAGVVTDYTEIGLLWTNIGRKTAMWLPIVTVPQVVLLGILANRIF